MIREHSEKIKPPRALWVPFPLGRPLGKAGDAAFQRDVLLAALKLLERDAGPILEEYPHDAEDDESAPPAACPVNFATVPPPQGEIGLLLQRFRDEVMAMQTWYELAKEKSGRTTAGISGLEAGGIADILAGFVEKGSLVPGIAGQTLAETLPRASEDLLAYYLEAASAQPGQSTHPGALAEWFWGETCAARVLNEVRKKCLQMDDKGLRLVGRLLLIPRNQLHRFET